jgi:hypothetical protein
MSVINLSKVDIFGNETGTINTANCYIVHEPGYYSIPLIYGNAIKNGKPNPEAYTNQKPGNYLFTDYVDYLNKPICSPEIKDKIKKVDVVWKSDGLTLKNLSFSDHELFFKLDKNRKRKTGENALVAIYDEDNTIIWSWHVWYYEGNLTPIYFGDHPRKKLTKNYQFAVLPVNLGWNGEIGTYYQWGRKDPFRGDIEKVDVLKRGEIFRSIREPEYMYEKLNYEGCVNLWDAKCENIEDEDNQNPNKSRLTIKTIYDPCPPGFKVPGCDVFQSLEASGVIGRWDNGLRFKGGRQCGPDGVFFPASGLRGRASGSLDTVSSYGYYWSSASSGSADAYYLRFYSGYAYPVSSYNRAYGSSVRPFLE